MMQGDPVLDDMAAELFAALVANGLDPSNPPVNMSPAPSEKAFANYQARGGTVYRDPDMFMNALIEKVKHT